MGLATILAEAGLTVGTFYTHFKSKEALVREVILLSLDERHQEMKTAIQRGDLELAVRAYLSAEHRDGAGNGCPVEAGSHAALRLAK